MLKIVWKLLVVIFVVVVLISCEIVNEYDARATKEKLESNSDFKKLCSNVSAIDLERNERIYQEFEKCFSDKIDPINVVQDIESIVHLLVSENWLNSTYSNKHIPVIDGAIKQYCPNATSVLKCTEILFPIYNECFTDDHSKYAVSMQQLKLSALDFLCEKDEKDTVRAIQFVDAQFFDCFVNNEDEFYGCMRESKLQLKKSKVDDDDEKVYWPTQNEICKFTETFGNCFVPNFEGCEMSKMILALIKSFRNHIQTDACASTANVTSSLTTLSKSGS